MSKHLEYCVTQQSYSPPDATNYNLALVEIDSDFPQGIRHIQTIARNLSRDAAHALARHYRQLSANVRRSKFKVMS